MPGKPLKIDCCTTKAIWQGNYGKPENPEYGLGVGLGQVEVSLQVNSGQLTRIQRIRLLGSKRALKDIC